ncbi:MAG: hypothetical protein ACOCX3_01185 [Chloroflexota bacterium]
MRTPAGKECKHYFEDFHRGRDVQECRLVKGNRASLPWRPEDCSRCPVPDILNANASPYMELQLTIKPRMLGFGRKMEVEAWCIRHNIPIEDPYVGCPKDIEERPGLDVFRRALDQSDDGDQ